MGKGFLLAPLLMAALMSSSNAQADAGQDLGNQGAYGAFYGQKKNLTTSTTGSMGSSATPGSNPANGSTSASASQSTTLEISCPTNNSNFDSSPPAYPLGMKVQCVKSTNGFVFRVCEGNAQGVDCDPNNTWEYQTLSPGGSGVFSSTLTASVGACSANACQVSFTQSGSFSGTGQDLTNQGVALAQSQSANEASPTNEINNVGLLNTTTGQMAQVGTSKNGGTYAANVIASGGSITSCFTTQQNQLSNGKDVFTCDGTQSVNFGNSCPATTSCAKYANTTNNYTQTCVANVPNHQITVHTVTPTVSCTITNPQVTFTCNKTASPNVQSTTVSDCAPGQVKYMIFPFDPATISNYTSRYIAFSWTGGGTYNDQFIAPLVATCIGNNQISINRLTNSMGNKSDSFNWFSQGGTPPPSVFTFSPSGDGGINDWLFWQVDGHVHTTYSVGCSGGSCTVSTWGEGGGGAICGPAGFATQTTVISGCYDQNLGGGCDPGNDPACICSSSIYQYPSPYYCNDNSGATTPVTYAVPYGSFGIGAYRGFGIGSTVTTTVNSVTRAQYSYQFTVSRKVQTLAPDSTTDGCTAYESAP